MSTPRLSQITIQDGISLYGRMAAMNAGGVTVVMESLPVNMEALNPGRTAEVLLNMPHGEYRMLTNVVHFESVSNKLLLTFTEAIQPVQRRGSYRLTVALPVTARALYDDGRIEAWQETATKDLSAGGMRVIMSNCLTAPQLAEVRFRVPGEREQINAACRVAHSKVLAAGRFEIGLAFSSLPTPDCVRVINFIERSASSQEAGDSGSAGQ